jgi:four helix bundle protein
MLPHESLEVYWLAEEYVAFIQHVHARIRRASKNDADQLDRQGGSMLYNIIEASADTSPGDKARFYRYARREVNESFGVFRKARLNNAITETELRIAHYYADRLSAALWGLIKRWERPSRS